MEGVKINPIIGEPQDFKQATLYNAEKSVIGKIKKKYSNQYMLSDILNELNKNNDIEDLKRLCRKEPEQIIIELIGEKTFRKFYPENL